MIKIYKNIFMIKPGIFDFFNPLTSLYPTSLLFRAQESTATEIDCNNQRFSEPVLPLSFFAGESEFVTIFIPLLSRKSAE